MGEEWKVVEQAPRGRDIDLLQPALRERGYIALIGNTLGSRVRVELHYKRVPHMFVATLAVNGRHFEEGITGKFLAMY